MANLSATQVEVLTFTPCVTGSLSILGSAAIIYSILSNSKGRLSKIYHRLILSLAIMDILSTVGSGLMSTFLAPRGIPGVYAFGNTQTCELQGFLATLGIAIPLYTLMLSIYYVLTICYLMKDNAIQKFERWFHIVPLGVSFGFATAALFLKLYNFQGNKCWISPYPFGCAENENIKCTRGVNAYLYAQLFFGVWLYLSLLGIAACMVYVYWTLRSREIEVGQYSFSHQVKNNQVQTKMEEERRAKHVLSKKMAKQGMLYVGALVLTYIWSIILHAVKAATGQTPFALLVLVQIFLPLQGLFNFVIYIRPYVGNIKTSEPDCSYLRATVLAIVSKSDKKPSDQSLNVRLGANIKRQVTLIFEVFKRNQDDKHPLDVQKQDVSVELSRNKSDNSYTRWDMPQEISDVIEIDPFEDNSSHISLNDSKDFNPATSCDRTSDEKYEKTNIGLYDITYSMDM